MHKYSDTHPLNVFTFCPRCGHEGFKFDQEKSFSCSKCNFVYFINPAPAVAVILETPDGKIVLTRRKFEPKAGYLDLPGGFVDPMERVEDAIRREILEELGIEVNDMHFLVSFPNEYEFKGISYYTCDLAFVCPVDNVSSMKPADDVTEAVVIHLHDIDSTQISFPSIISILEAYSNYKKDKSAR